MTTEEDIKSQIYAWDTEKLYALFTQLGDMVDEEDLPLKINEADRYKKVKEGINVKIPISYIINRRYEERPEYNSVAIYPFGKFKLTDLDDEIDIRKTLMRQIISEYYGSEELTDPRN